MGVNARGAVDPRYQRRASRPLLGFQLCTIQIVDMNTSDALNDYDVFTNSGSSTPEILWQGPASMNVSRQPRNADEAASAVTQLRFVTFETPLGAKGPQFTVLKGMAVLIAVCEDNPGACRYQYWVNSGLNQSLPLANTIMCVADLGVEIAVPELV